MMSKRVPWPTVIVTEPPLPADAIDPDSVESDAWVRIVPFAFSEYDGRTSRLVRASPSQKGPPMREWTVDRKCVAPLDFYFGEPNVLCSEAVLNTLQKLGVAGFTARPIAHGSPEPVRGHALYDLTLPGIIGPPLPSSYKGRPKKPTPFGVPGAPCPPVTLEGKSWTGDPLCLTDWLEAETNRPYQALIARGDFIQALCKETSGKPGVVLQSVSVEGLKKARQTKREPATWEPAPTPWKHPTRWKGSVLDRIEKTAKEYRHSMPGPADPKRLKKVFAELNGKYGCRFDPLLEKLLLAHNGPSLFDGLLTFFSIGPRTKANPVPVHAHSVPPEDMVLANSRVSETDWMITRAPGSVLFAARYAEMHAMWALTAEGNVRLLPQSGEVLGPDIPFEPWLEDQVADLEWATENRGALGQWEHTWLK